MHLPLQVEQWPRLIIDDEYYVYVYIMYRKLMRSWNLYYHNRVETWQEFKDLELVSQAEPFGFSTCILSPPERVYS